MVMNMVRECTGEQLSALFDGDQPFALIDVREPVEYNAAHIPGASLIPRRRLEFEVRRALPYRGVAVVLCDENGRNASRAAVTLSRAGYSNVSVLKGGVNRWAADRRPTEWGVNVPSKAFGERVEVEHDVPTISADELHRRLERGDNLVILDTRTPEEYRRMCIPGGRSVPGGELALRITDIRASAPEDATIVVNCAGRTRSIIGTRLLQRMGMGDGRLYGLENGTAGWGLAGYELESGADRTDLPEPSPDGVVAAERFARRVAEEDGVVVLDVVGLRALMARREAETVYIVDVRLRDEYEAGHIPGCTWMPGGQAVQTADAVAVVHNAPIIFVCDGVARSAIAASWYRQMGHRHVYAVDGGTAAWVRAGLELESVSRAPNVRPPSEEMIGIDEARSETRSIGADELASGAWEAVLFVGASAEFAAGHVPGAHWVSRGVLEDDAAATIPGLESPVVTICGDSGVSAALAAATLSEMGYRNVAWLDGGMEAWRAGGGPVETGLTGVMSPPLDVLPAGTNRSYGDMINYLRWETALGRSAGGGSG